MPIDRGSCNKVICRTTCLLILILAVILVSAAYADQVIRVASTSELLNAIRQTEAQSEPVVILLEQGTYRIDQPIVLRRPQVQIIGADRDEVTLDGGGMKEGSSHIFLIEASDVTIENLTLGWVRNHGIQVRGENGISNTTIRNIKFVDTYEQMLKVSTNKKNPAKFSSNGLVEDCLFTYSADFGPQWYIGGIDAHNAHDWVVRNNYFENIRSPERRIAEHAIHFWSGSVNTLVENNTIVNSDRGIGFGLGRSGHLGGVIQGNQVKTVRDVGIGLESASGVQVLNNTVTTENYPNSIEYRFPDSRNILIKGNRTSGAIVSRDGGQAVVQ